MPIRSLIPLTVVLAAGIGIGSMRSSLVSQIEAQDDAVLESPLSEDAANQIRAVNRSLESARDELETEGRYRAATDAVNPFLIMVGGGDAIADLESDDGVDPETFAALYAGMASEAIKDDVTIDDEGRVRYKGKVVRMYSIKRLKQMYARRSAMSGAGN